jgi:hypothetical protein
MAYVVAVDHDGGYRHSCLLTNMNRVQSLNECRNATALKVSTVCTTISASLCSYLIMTRGARLGLNGPEVIEEQSGIEEFDSKDRQLIWGVNGGEQRYATGFADYLAEDDVEAIKGCIVEAFGRGIPTTHRSEQVDDYLERLAAIDVSHQLESSEVRKLWSKPAWFSQHSPCGWMRMLALASS